MKRMAIATILLALAACASDGTFKDAAEAMFRGDHEKSLAIWARLAKRGDVRSQFRLGRAYYTGRGTAKDPDKAFKWLRRAALGGYKEAMETLADLYHQGYGTTKSVKDAVRWYEIAAEAGVHDAHMALGYIYQTGEGVEVDYARAFHHYAEAGRGSGDNVSGRFQMGEMLLAGEGRQSDPEQAITHFQAAVDGGGYRALRTLGDLYREGRAVPPDAERAKAYYERAAALEDSHALYYLGVISRDVDHDPTRALGWWKKAAELQTVHAPFEIGDLYRSGQLSEPDGQVKALGWFMVGVDLDDGRASQARDETAALLTPEQREKSRLWAESFLRSIGR